MKISLVVEARPEFVQCSILLKEIEKKNKVILIHTGQHYDYEMSKLFFDQLHILKTRLSYWCWFRQPWITNRKNVDRN